MSLKEDVLPLVSPAEQLIEEVSDLANHTLVDSQSMQ